LPFFFDVMRFIVPLVQLRASSHKARSLVTFSFELAFSRKAFDPSLFLITSCFSLSRWNLPLLFSHLMIPTPVVATILVFSLHQSPLLIGPAARLEAFRTPSPTCYTVCLRKTFLICGKSKQVVFLFLFVLSCSRQGFSICPLCFLGLFLALPAFPSNLLTSGTLPARRFPSPPVLGKRGILWCAVLPAAYSKQNLLFLDFPAHSPSVPHRSLERRAIPDPRHPAIRICFTLSGTRRFHKLSGFERRFFFDT